MLEGARELMHLWDNHERRRLFSWKSLIHCEKNPEAIKAELRSNIGVSIYLFREGKEL